MRLQQFAVQQQPNAQELVQHHEHADHEVDIAAGLGAGGRWQAQTAFAQQTYEDTLVVQHEIGDTLVESKQEDPEQQPCDLRQHIRNGKGGHHAAQSGKKPSTAGFLLFTDSTTELLKSSPRSGKFTSFQRDTLALVTMHPDLAKLLELEKLNQHIAALNNEIAALPQRVAAIEKKLAGTQAQVDGAKAALKQVETSKRKFEGEIQALHQKISKYRDQSLNVKTNQEYKAINDEIAFAQAEIRRLEDKILDGMAETESREQELKKAETELAAERKEIQKEQAEAHERTAEDQQKLAELTPQRDAIRAGLDEARLRQYDRLVKLRGSGISAVRDGKCMACYVMLRPQTYNDVRGDIEVVTCDSCGRFLYYEAPAEIPATPAANGVAGQP